MSLPLRFTASSALVGAGFYFRQQIQDQLAVYTAGNPFWILVGALLVTVVSCFAGPLSVGWQFVWNCFLRPLGKNETQKGRLDAFYQGQAAIYDSTRTKLLKGRTTMLKLSAAQLKEQRRQDPNKRLIWLDIGGGTGWNIEQMDQYFPIADFDAVYVLDLCEPLLEVSRKRFAARGWTNVTCLLQDATTFTLPEWEKFGVDTNGALDFVSMSYSLSMMPDYLSLVDRIERFLTPTGLLAVCDFFVSGREHTALAGIIGDVASRQCSWLSSVFWLNWFSFDHVDLHPSRRAYVEHRFGTIKSYNGRNIFCGIPFIRIPYYVSLMTSRRTDTSKANRAYEHESGNTISASNSPLLVPVKMNGGRSSPLASPDIMPELSLGLAALSRTNSSKKLTRMGSRDSDDKIDVAPEPSFSSFHFGAKTFRVPYIADPVHNEFRTWIYGFAWEDPAVDLEHLNITRDDNIMCITSAGCNALHYAIAARPNRIHAVDMNPVQGHLLELKLAGISALDYNDFWLMFGEGKHPNFRQLLDEKLSPFLTSHAYQFWRANDQAFSQSFYLRGYSGWALRLAKYALWISGLSGKVEEFCTAPTLEAQRALWNTKFRPVILSKLIVNVFLSSPAFLWNALGVPINQAKVFLSETTTKQFAIDTLDPVALNTHIAGGAYHYQVCFEQKYRKNSCPLYLTEEGFNGLKKDNGKAMDCFRLHTDSINNVMSRLGPGSLTIAIIMDLQDWFRNSLSDKEDAEPCALTLTIRQLHRALSPGGRVFWRSAGLTPWYVELYKREGFEVKCVHQREIGSKIPIDRVNMYASFWVCEKRK